MKPLTDWRRPLGDAALAVLTNVGYDEGVLKPLTEVRRRREAAWILAGGAAVAAAPAFWYSQVWPDAVRYGQDSTRREAHGGSSSRAQAVRSSSSPLFVKQAR